MMDLEAFWRSNAGCSPRSIEKHWRLPASRRRRHWTTVTGIVGRHYDVRLPNPVVPGDATSGQSQIQEIRFRPEKRDGVVIFRTELVNEEGLPILIVVVDALVHARPA
jgi:acyl dehydratase